MEENPFSAPPSLGGDQSAKGGASVRYRTFRSSSTSFRLTIGGIREPVRKAVRKAIENEIGVENVISIHEMPESFGNFSITVWYKDYQSSGV